MDKENVIVKVEQEEFVVVKEETVDLTYKNVYDIPKDISMISLDSEPLPDVPTDPRSDGLKLSDANVKSSFIISKGVKSAVFKESSKYEVLENGERCFINPLTNFSHPVVPPFPLPYLAHTMPWGMYPHSPSLPYPYYQLPMTPFPMHNYPHMFGHVRHPHLDVSEKPTTETALFGHLGTPESMMYQSVQRQDCMYNLNLDKRPLPPGKVKKRHLATSVPYNRSELKQAQVDSSLVNAKPTKNIAYTNIIEHPSVTANQKTDPGFVDVDGLDDTSAIDKYNLDRSHPFKCIHCGRGFAKKYYLSVHMRIHTEDRSYRCSQCPKAYKARNALVIHLRNHHECSLCDRRFSNKSDIKRHFKTHIPEKSREIDYNELKRT